MIAKLQFVFFVQDDIMGNNIKEKWTCLAMGGMIMQTIKALCKPRENVFADTARDDVLNLSDLIEGKPGS